MQTLVAVCVVMLGAAMGMPTQEVSNINTDVLQHTEIRDEAGQYSLSYLTADGIAFAEQGALKPNRDGTDNVLVKQVELIDLGNELKKCKKNKCLYMFIGILRLPRA